MFNPLNLISKLIKSGNQRELEKVKKIVDKVNNLEKGIGALKDDEFPKKTENFVELLKNGKTFGFLKSIFLKSRHFL